MVNNTLVVTLTRGELEDLIINSVQVCLKNQTPVRNTIPDEAAPSYVSKREAARLISVCASTIDNAARAGRLKRHYVGKSVRFERSQVLALAKSHTNHKRSN